MKIGEECPAPPKSLAKSQFHSLLRRPRGRPEEEAAAGVATAVVIEGEVIYTISSSLSAGSPINAPSTSDSRNSDTSVPVEIWEGDDGFGLLDQLDQPQEHTMMKNEEIFAAAAAAAATFDLNTPMIDDGDHLSPSDLFPALDEFAKPLIDPLKTSFDETWDETVVFTSVVESLFDNEMTCVNPMDVEGMQILDAPVVFDTEPHVPFVSVASAERPRKRLRLIMPKPEEPECAAPTTPEMVDAIEESLLKNSEASIDLLAYVTDATIKVDDPAFLAFIGSTTPSVMEQQESPMTLMPATTSAKVPPKGKRMASKGKKAATDKQRYVIKKYDTIYTLANDLLF